LATPPGFSDVSIRFDLAGMARPAYVTFAVDSSETDPLLTAADVLNAWSFTGSINARLDSNVTVSEITVRQGTDGGEDLVGVLSATTVGGRAGTSGPPSVAVLVHKRTARGGRRGRGRMFLPWCLNTSSVSENGVIQTSDVNTIAASCIVFKDQLAASGSPMVLLHNPGQTAMGPPDLVTTMSVSPLIGTQRRRLGR
jgi:hypothetical protein